MRAGFGPPVCLVPLSGPDEFARLLTREWVLDDPNKRMVRNPMGHGAAIITVDGRTFRKSGQRTQGGWLIYRERP